MIIIVAKNALCETEKEIKSIYYSTIVLNRLHSYIDSLAFQLQLMDSFLT